jgi:hypothetical protein
MLYGVIATATSPSGCVATGALVDDCAGASHAPDLASMRAAFLASGTIGIHGRGIVRGSHLGANQPAIRRAAVSVSDRPGPPPSIGSDVI